MTQLNHQGLDTLTLSQTTNVRKILQTTISYLMKMVESSSKWIENTVGKGQIACYEQFLLFFLQCFRKTCTVDTLKTGLVWERINSQH